MSERNKNQEYLPWRKTQAHNDSTHTHLHTNTHMLPIRATAMAMASADKGRITLNKGKSKGNWGWERSKGKRLSSALIWTHSCTCAYLCECVCWCACKKVAEYLNRESRLFTRHAGTCCLVLPLVSSLVMCGKWEIEFHAERKQTQSPARTHGTHGTPWQK